MSIEEPIQESVEHASAMIAALRVQQQRLTALTDVMRSVSATLDTAAVSQRLVDGLCTVLGANAAGLYLAEGARLRLQAAARAGQLCAEPELPGLLPDTQTIPQVHQGRAVLIPVSEWQPLAALDVTAITSSVLLIPFHLPPDGILCIYLPSMSEAEAEIVAFARALVDHGVVAMQHAQAHEALQRAEKQRSQFVRVVTHELRSPVVGAQSMLRAVMHSSAYGFTAEQRDILGRLSRRMDSLLDLINDLLSLAATRASDYQQPLVSVHIQPIVRETVEYLRFQSEEKKHRMEVVLPPLPIHILGTKDGFQHILENLVGNAVKYTPEGGTIRIALRREQHTARLRVEDSGIGIPPEALEQLGQEFFRAANAKAAGVSGTGLGLTMVRLILDRFGGRMQVESQVNSGTTFIIELPLA